MAVSSIGRPPRVTSRVSSSSSRSAKASCSSCPPCGEARAAQDRADPGDQLLEAERLRDVVVAAERQPADHVLGRVARGEEEDRHLGARRASRRATSKPSMSGSITSSTISCGRSCGDRRDRLGAGGGRRDGEAVEAQRHRDDVDDVGLVVDDEDAELSRSCSQYRSRDDSSRRAAAVQFAWASAARSRRRAGRAHTPRARPGRRTRSTA